MNTIHATNPLMHGPDVKAVQQLLIKRGLLPAGSDDGIAGPQTLHAFVAAKRLYSYPVKEQTLTCGDRLVQTLETGKSPFHHIPILHHHPQDLSEELKTRARMAELMDAGVHNEVKIHYAQVRPIPEHITVEHWSHEEVSTDCSGAVTIVCKLAGVPKDPNGENWSGLGYTGTIMAHARPITHAELQVGDFIVFGPYPGHHVVQVRRVAANPQVFSHGQEKGPWFTTLSDEAQYQSPVIHYYSAF